MSGVICCCEVQRLRGVAFLLVGMLCACRTAPRRTCYPANGREIWVERHLRAQPSADGRVPVKVRFVSDTSSKTRRSEQAVLMISAGSSPQAGQSIRQNVMTNAPAVVRLTAGTYRFRVSSIGYEPSVHLVDVVAEDSIIVEAQLRGAAYCEEIVRLAHP